MVTCSPLRRVGAVALSLVLTSVTATLLVAQTQRLPLEKDHAARMGRSSQLFKQHVRPILLQKCLRCHGGKTTEAEFDLHSREGILKGGTSGSAVVPGKAKESLLYRV